MIKILITISILLGGLNYAFSQSLQSDTIKEQTLNEVIVEGSLQRTSTQKSIYIPTSAQKRSAQTGLDLISRMGIPQVYVDPISGTIQSVGGKNVSIYIDYVPATENELKMMRLSDVVRVEYLSYPSDSRFRGDERVVNFIMRKYEYGGYVKLYPQESFIVNTGSLQGNVRIQYKRMVYDLMGFGKYNSNNAIGGKELELFKIPYNGQLTMFDRQSVSSASKFRQQYYQGNFRALYKSDKFTANTQISGGIDRKPHNDWYGHVEYSLTEYPHTDYLSSKSSDNKFISYAGNYFYYITKRNSLAANLEYTYSTTNERSLYKEDGFDRIDNSAKDKSHNATAYFQFSHIFGNKSQINLHNRTTYLKSNTIYSGSSIANDNSDIFRTQLGISYSRTIGKFYGKIGIGWSWIKSTLNDNKVSSNEPYVDASFQHSFNDKNSLNFDYHFAEWSPSPNYKSDIIKQVSPFMWHTGNPRLMADKSHDVGLQYIFLPSNKWNISISSSFWWLKDRYAFIYEPNPNALGVIRTIQQPLGGYSEGRINITGSLRMINRKLQITGNVTQKFINNGNPYNYNENYISFYIQAFYYFRNFNLGLSYISSSLKSGSSRENTIIKDKSSYWMSIGWNVSDWNLRFIVRNIGRWDWDSRTLSSKNQYYDYFRTQYGVDKHARITLSVTYTLGFGKKIKRGNELGEQSKGSSGILK